MKIKKAYVVYKDHHDYQENECIFMDMKSAEKYVSKLNAENKVARKKWEKDFMLPLRANKNRAPFVADITYMIDELEIKE
jgi:hypothetical protein